MARKRLTKEDDVRRLAERITNEYPDIETKEDFDRAFDLYMDGVALNYRQDKILREKTFIESSLILSNLSDDVVISSKDAKGKKPRRDEQGVVRLNIPNAEAFRYVGFVKARLVFCRKIKFIIKGNEVTRYIDRRGRFVSTRTLSERYEKID